MPLQLAADSFHTKKLCSRLSSSEMRLFRKNGRFAFFSPPLRDLGATYDDYVRLIGKRVGDFLLVLIELFSLGVTAEPLRVIICSKLAISLQRGSVDPKFQVEGTPSSHSFYQKTRINYLWYGIKIQTHLFSVLSQSTRLTDGQMDGWTDRQTDGQNSHRKTASAFHAAR